MSSELLAEWQGTPISSQALALLSRTFHVRKYVSVILLFLAVPEQLVVTFVSVVALPRHSRSREGLQWAPAPVEESGELDEMFEDTPDHGSANADSGLHI